MIKQHTTNSERLRAAEILRGEITRLGAPQSGRPPIVVDTLRNEASYAYGALPERLVILQGGVVRFVVRASA